MRMLSDLRRMIIKNRETIVYLIVGAIVSGVNWGIYTVFSSWLNVDINVSNVIAWIFAVIIAFVLNKQFVFLSYNWDFQFLMKEFISFLSCRIFTGIIEIGMLPALLYMGVDYSLFGIKAGIAKAISCIVGIVLNYLFSKFFIFKKMESS